MKITRYFSYLLVSVILVLGLNTSFAEEQQPRVFNPHIDADSMAILEQMDAYLSPIEAFSFQVNITDQYGSSNGEKIEIKKTTKLTVRRPDRIQADVQMIEPELKQSFYYDGKTLTLFNRTHKLFAQSPVPGTNQEMLDFAMDELGFTFPIVDFIFKNLHETLTENVLYSDYIGKTALNGRECHLLTFNQDEIDWYLWVDAGKKTIPRKFLIVYKNDPQRSKFSAEFTKHKALKNVSDDQFNFVPSNDYEQIEFLPVEHEHKEEVNDENS